MKFHELILQNHIACFGKTGSGKTTTAKLIVENVVANGDRVCVLDPIKSDWWGITSSADGKKAGLSFDILGGPHGHVPLHSGAGKAIGELVATGQLPLSVIDMADFEAGGLQKFFVDFAGALMRKMRGVLYLVLEEAHEFAPKEMAGLGNERMAIHLAKKLATAGRSKGIRLVFATHRTQSLHNALIGSCETMYAHRITAPADQEPVRKWLKANAPKELVDNIAESLSGIPTGSAWECSAVGQIFELRKFPRTRTFDNTATPTSNSGEVTVKTAKVDSDKLRSLIGKAVDEAKADDPKELKKKIADLEKQLAMPAAVALAKAPADADVRKRLEDFAKQAAAESAGWKKAVSDCEKIIRQLTGRLQKIGELTGLAIPVAPPVETPSPAKFDLSFASRVPSPILEGNGAGSVGKGAIRSILIALAQHPEGLSYRQIGLFADVSVKGGSFRTYLSTCRTGEWITAESDKHRTQITPTGLAALGSYTPLPTGSELAEHWLTKAGGGACGKIFRAVLDAYPNAISYAEIEQRAEVSIAGGSFRTYLSWLRGRDLIVGDKRGIKACEELFG